MRVGGRGTERLLVVIPLAVLVVVAVILSGGPRPFLQHVENVLDAMVGGSGRFRKAVLRSACSSRELWAVTCERRVVRPLREGRLQAALSDAA
jgi:hypothetical protein